jgi:hypothetical protein
VPLKTPHGPAKYMVAINPSPSTSFRIIFPTPKKATNKQTWEDNRRADTLIITSPEYIAAVSSKQATDIPVLV